jgi:hypothetical protein
MPRLTLTQYGLVKKPKPLDEFQAMRPGLRELATFWLQHGFWPPGLPASLLERLEAWSDQTVLAGPATLAALRAEAALVSEAA